MTIYDTYAHWINVFCGLQKIASLLLATLSQNIFRRGKPWHTDTTTKIQAEYLYSPLLMTMTMSNNWQICSLFTLTLNSKTRNSIWHNWIRNESTNQELQAAHLVTKATLDMMSVCIASESSPLAVIIPIVGIPDGKGRIFTPSMASFASLMATHENHGLWSCFIFFTLPYRNPNYWHRPHLFRFHQLNWMVTRLQMTPNGSNGWQWLSLHNIFNNWRNWVSAPWFVGKKACAGRTFYGNVVSNTTEAASNMLVSVTSRINRDTLHSLHLWKLYTWVQNVQSDTIETYGDHFTVCHTTLTNVERIHDGCGPKII